MFIMVRKGLWAVIISHIAELLYQRDPDGLMSATECSDLEVGHTYPSYSVCWPTQDLTQHQRDQDISHCHGPRTRKLHNDDNPEPQTVENIILPHR